VSKNADDTRDPQDLALTQPAAEASRYINPWRLFYGAIIPNWLIGRSELSPGAKLTYARLVQYAGKSGRCFPRQETLGEELGVSKRHCGRYISELVRCGLIESKRTGNKSANEYVFPRHPWIEERSDRTDPSCQKPVDRTDMSSPDRTDPSGPLNKNQKEIESTTLALEIYDHYASKIRRGARADAIRSIGKLLTQYDRSQLIASIERYAGNGMPAEVKYRIQANNFFGRAARFQEYLKPSPGSVNQSRYENLNDKDPCAE
jgi:hypothetical protein